MHAPSFLEEEHSTGTGKTAKVTGYSFTYGRPMAAGGIGRAMAATTIVNT